MKEYIDLECKEERLDLRGKQLEKVVIESNTLKSLDLGNNNLKEITLECPNLQFLWLRDNPYNTMKVSLVGCPEKQNTKHHLKDFFGDIHSPSEEEILVFKVIIGYECPWAYALTRYLYEE